MTPAPREVATGLRFPEGPVAMPDGSVILVEIESQHLTRVKPGGAIERIAHRLRALGEREVPSRQVGEFVMEELRHLDEVAYVRFASVYRKFEDVQAFREEIERLERDLPGLETLQLPLLESVPEKAKR